MTLTEAYRLAQQIDHDANHCRVLGFRDHAGQWSLDILDLRMGIVFEIKELQEWQRYASSDPSARAC